jgi:hypothetical protein
MECEAARGLMADGEFQGAVAAHLEGCPVCRAEAEFRRRVAAAVAALPRERAPEGLVAGVMVEVRQRPEAARPAALHHAGSVGGGRPADYPRPQLALRPWEMGWVGAFCLALLAIVPTALSRWTWSWAPDLSPGSLWAWVATLRVEGAGPLGGLRAWGHELSGVWSWLLERGAGGAGPWLTGLCGAAAFAVGFYLLLSWREEGGGMQAMEDAHA